MSNPKAIETLYAGCRFRSRLEARWAVFFDTLGIEWEYETEGYELPSGERYLPDFKLRGLWNAQDGSYVWFEVKPDPQLNQTTVDKLGDLCRVTNKFGYFSMGMPGQERIHAIVRAFVPGVKDTGDPLWMSSPSMMSWARFPADGRYGIFAIIQDGEPVLWNGFPVDAFKSMRLLVHDVDFQDENLRRAYVASRSARFEFGEHGITK